MSDPSSWVVLVVDDDDDNLGVLQQLMEFLGAEYHPARNGQDALELLNRITPTIVLLDLSMPVLDGWGLLKQIRAADGKLHLPVIAVTAHAMAGDQERALAAGFDAYISKPFMFGEMIAEMKRCIGG